MDLALSILSNIPIDFWAYLAGATGLSALLIKVKRKLNDPTDKTMMTLNVTLSMLMALVPAILNGFGPNAGAVYGQRVGAIVGLMTVVYHFIVKPSNKFLNDTSNHRHAGDTATVTPVEQLAPVLVGTAGISLVNSPTVVDEFDND